MSECSHAHVIIIVVITIIIITATSIEVTIDAIRSMQIARPSKSEHRSSSTTGANVRLWSVYCPTPCATLALPGFRFR